MEPTAKHPRLVTLAGSALAVAALYWGREVLIPFALAVLVSFLLAPLVLRLQRWRFSRIMAVLTALLLVSLVSLAAGWLVLGQARDMTAKLTDYRQNIQVKLSTLRGVLTEPVQVAADAVTDLGAELSPSVEPEPKADPIQRVRVVAPVRGTFEVLGDALRPMLDVFMTAGMALLFAVVMLLRRDDLGDRLVRIIGDGEVLVTTRALEEAATKVSSYLWRLLLLNSAHGLAVGIGLTLLGVPNAFLWGLLSATLRFIPYVGPWIAATLPVLTSLAVSPGWTQPLLTIGLFVLLELISNNLIEPWIYRKGTGISPLAILVSTMFWTWVWGPVGLVLATPLTVCMVVMGKHVPQFGFLHRLFEDAPGLLPSTRLYRRLIAGDQDDAWIVLRTELEQRSMCEVYDAVVLPALSMAARDRRRGALDQEAEDHIEEAMRLLLDEAGARQADTAAGVALAPEAALADPVRVCCLPARGTLDGLAATMLRQILELDGFQVEVVSSTELVGESMELMQGRRVDLVCISAVSPSRFLHTRYLCKRIAARFPGLPIIAGMWTLDVEAQALAERMPVVAGVRVVVSLAEAREAARRLAPTARLQRPTPAPSVATPFA